MKFPVIGLPGARMASAAPLSPRFVIVTPLPRMIPYTQALVPALGFAARLAAVRSVGLPPVGKDEPPAPEVVRSLAAEVPAAHASAGADLAILGGSRLSPYAAALRGCTPLVVIEPLACTVALAESLARLGLRQSKAGKFAPPPRPLGEYD